MEFVTAYGPKRRVQVSFEEDGAGRTKQDFAEECDINNILAKYVKTGVLAHANKYAGQYGDATGHDFQSAMETVTNAQTMFEELPAKIRERFGHNPAEFLDYVADPENIPEMESLGLINPRPQEEPKNPSEEPRGAKKTTADKSSEKKSEE